MKLTDQIAKHLRDVHFGGNWTWVNFKETLADVTWQQATTHVHSFNTIATLMYHMNYYLNAVLGVLQDKPLTAKHEHSFVHPPVQSKEDWDALLEQTWNDVEKLATTIQAFPESRLQEIFREERYGNYYRNMQGIIEHAHYHLGQIVLIKKLLAETGGAA